MKKTFLFLLLFVQLAVQADVIDRKTARSVACAFLGSECEEVSLNGTDFGNQADLYIFNRCDSTGFVILSANDCAQGILAFSFDNYFKADKIPDNCRAFLKRYRSDIKCAAKRKVRSKFQAPESGAKGMRLVTPEWDQSTHPYNALTPANVPAGCVPAAMGIVMGAWRWPAAGEGVSTHSGTVYEGDIEIPYDFNLDHDISFNLDRLPYKYIQGETSLEDEESLAQLMLHLGVAVNARYSPDGTGAYISNSRTALIDHFKFDPGAVYACDEITDYESILRKEINEKRPVICSIPGHAVVCDGVLGNYFHFNFGWGGFSNGYYLLSTFPDDTGSGEDVFVKGVVYGLKPDASCSDYTSRSVESVYDEVSSEKPEIVISDKYSPVELCSDGGKWPGIASPFDSYPIGKSALIYVSGLKLTGRFDGSADSLDKTSWQEFDIAVGIVDNDEKIRAVYPGNSSVQVFYNDAVSYVKTLKFSPDIGIMPSDRIVVLMRRNSENDWKIVKGMPDVSSELKPTQPSSEYLPFSLIYDSSDFRIEASAGQLENKVVKGQNYAVRVYPLADISSIDVKVNGKSTDFEAVSYSGNTYYYVSKDVIDCESFNLAIEALTTAQTDVVVNLSEPGALADMLGGKEGRIRNLTIIGKINAIDMRYISADRFPVLRSLNLSEAEITGYLSIFPSGSIIGDMLSGYCRIEELRLPRTLTQIKDGAFYACGRLRSISIPEDVAYIPRLALAFNSYEKVVNYSMTPQSICDYFVESLDPNSTLLVPAGAKAAYEAHPLWSRFSAIKEFDPSGMPDIAVNDPERNIKVYLTSEGRLAIRGLENTLPVKVYDYTGMVIWSGSSDTAGTLSLPALCIVSVGSRVFRLMR